MLNCFDGNLVSNHVTVCIPIRMTIGMFVYRVYGALLHTNGVIVDGIYFVH